MKLNHEKVIKRSRKKIWSDNSFRKGIEEAGETLNIFTKLPLSTHLLYYVGVLPFVTVFLFFVFDMLNNANANARLLNWALILPSLFLWMKFIHVFYMRSLCQQVFDMKTSPTNLKGVLRVLVFCAFLQPFGFILTPLSVLSIFSYASTLFFFDDLLIADDLYSESMFSRCKESYKVSISNIRKGWAGIWLLSPVHLGFVICIGFIISLINKYFIFDNYFYIVPMMLYITLFISLVPVLLLASPFGIMIMSSIAVILLFMPYVIGNLLGIETEFAFRADKLVSDTNFIFAAYSIAYIILDPLMKILVVKRRFDFISKDNGKDILLALKKFSSKVSKSGFTVLFLLLILMPSVSTILAETRDVYEEERSAELFDSRKESLDAALDSTLKEPRYGWKARQQIAGEKIQIDSKSPKWLKDLRKRIEKLVQNIKDWLERLFKKEEPVDKIMSKTPVSLGDIFQNATYVLIGLFVIIFIIYFIIQKRKNKKQVMSSNIDLQAKVVDINDEKVSAEDLSTDKWLEMALNFASQSDFRSAIRALFLGALANIGEHGMISLRSYKTNKDYLNELSIRTRNNGSVIEIYKHLRMQMEYIWYGFEPATNELFFEYKDKFNGLKNSLNTEISNLSYSNEEGVKR